MAEFEEAFGLTMGAEGGYSNDSDDLGGETYMGISRVHNPQWDGWETIDESKEEADFPKCLDDDEDLQDEVEEFYETSYWDVNQLDEFPQDVANEMFDTGVNLGTHKAAKFFQEACNYLNRNGELFDDLVVDGVVGSTTIKALDVLEETEDIGVLVVIMNVLQGQHYLNYMKKSPIQEKYARGWLKRVSL